MSKHSKNNTSSSVFTYAQRQKLKNIYGTIHTRIGEDSKKKFQDCTICQNKMIEPTSCDHGHTFCRSCVIEFIVKQKKKIAYEQTMIEKQKETIKAKDRENQLKCYVQKLQNFQKYDNFINITQRNHLLKNEQEFKNKKQQKIDIKNHIKPTGIYQQNQQKEKYTKSSFWVIENTPQIQERLQQRQQKFVQCPGAGSKHRINLKRLRDLKLNQLDNRYCCWICRKQFAKQRIGSYKCGHAMCEKCKSEKCQICNSTQKWFQLQGNQSSFASRNNVEVKTYTHAFIS